MSAPTQNPNGCHLVLSAHDFGHVRDAAHKTSDSISLRYEERLLRRKKLTTQSGKSILLDLEKVTNLEHDGALVLNSGVHIRVVAAPESVLAIYGHNLPQLAWHIGNRHTPCQVEAERLIILQDHVLEKMLRHLGADVETLILPFTPEGGAYGHGRTFGHSHGPADHAHEH